MNRACVHTNMCVSILRDTQETHFASSLGIKVFVWTVLCISETNEQAKETDEMKPLATGGSSQFI
jgi:hypothetical protein